MLAVVQALADSIGFRSTAIFARAGIKGIRPLPSTIISILASFVSTLLLAPVFLQGLERVTEQVVAGTSLMAAGVVLVIIGSTMQPPRLPGYGPQGILAPLSRA